MEPADRTPARLRKLRIAVVAALALSGMVAAFATIPPSQSETELHVARSLAPESVAVDPGAEVLASPAHFIREERFQSGETLATLFARLGVGEDDVEKLLRLKELRRLRSGSTVTAEIGPEAQLLRLYFLAGREALGIVRRAEDSFQVTEERAALETRVIMKSGVIRSSLFAATDAIQVPDAIAMQLADIFGGDIDFHRGLRKGDRFSVVYELQTFNAQPVRTGRVLAAEFRNQDRTHRAVWYTGVDGKGGYYGADGKNLRKAFLRSPLEFSRITSGFGMRHHPFLQTWRAHAGVDYAAPAGTRVRAVGDGIVDFVGRQGGYGNMIMIRHQGNVVTVYAHLLGFVQGLRKGQQVAQGETIGAVGQTGWATGPHLHYEFRIAGEARNPLAVVLPAALPVADGEMGAFRGQVQPLVVRLDLAGQGDLALLE
jgi:murein DD-endopeptidase MepM/ murein hydrolase activator NlpD